MSRQNPSKLFINSDHRRDYDSADNFTVTLDVPIERPKSIMLRTSTIPLTCYNIPAYEGTFYWYIYDRTDWVLKSLTINTQRAFLTPVQLVNQFNSDALAANAGISLTFDPDNTSSTYSANAANAFSYRISVTCSTAFRLPGWADTTSLTNTPINMYFNLNQRLGFTNKNVTQQYASPNTLKADSPPNLQRTSTIFVRCSLGNDTLSTPLPTGTSFRDILLSVPCNSLYGDIVVYKENSATGHIINHMSDYIKTITVLLLDDQFAPLGLPSNAISTFEFCFTY